MSKTKIEGSYLDFNGYHLPKENLTKIQTTNIKKNLTVIPQNNEYTGKSEEETKYKVYKETNNEFIIPKYFGIENFGMVKENYINKKTNIEFKGELRDYQKPIIEKCLKHLKKHDGGLLSVPCGMGKCLQKGTPIIMYDGSIKKVEDIIVGDEIMGDDSTKRTVLSLARGEEEMFDIIPSKGEKYTVNRSHILSLKWGATRSENMNGIKYHKDDIIDISVDDYLKLPKMFNDSRVSPLRGYRIPLNFPEKEINIDPYFLGLWLGDRTSSKMEITSIDNEIINYCKQYADKLGLNFHPRRSEDITYALAKKTRSEKNPIVEEFKKINLMNNKHIPNDYKCNSREVRLKVLAGLLDTDGTLTQDKTGFEIVQKNDKLSDDIEYLAKSLGFFVAKKKCVKKCTNSRNPNHQGIYNRITIFGNCDEIPTLLERKKAKKRTQIKNVLNYGITVKSVGLGEYYGFEIDGNKRFVLGDFTVTHNTSMAIYMASVLGNKTLILTHKTFLQDQWVDRIKQFTNSKVGIIRQNVADVDGKDFVIGMIHSIAKRDYDPDLFKDFNTIVIDECHHFSAKVFANALFKCSAKYTIGLSATPYRNDGLMKVTNWFVGDIMYQKKLKINNQVVSKIITFTSDNELFKEIRQPRKSQIKGKWITEMKPNYVQMITNITKIKERNDLIISIIDHLRRDPNRKILILSDRIDHLTLLKESVDKKIKESVDALQILPDECKTYFYIGNSKRKQREEAELEADILFGSYGLAKEGLDIDRLNTIILATPQKDVIQAVGRILRKVLQDGDVRPLIIDIADKMSMFPSQLKKREDFYTKSKYIQHYYYTQNTNFISASKYLEIIGSPSKSASEKKPKDLYDVLDVPLVQICENEKETEEDSHSSKFTNNGNDEKPKKTFKKIVKKETKKTIKKKEDDNCSISSSSVSSTESMKLNKKKSKKETQKKEENESDKPKKVKRGWLDF